MSRLHDPGPGEILDRLTILALKITHAAMRRHPYGHWEQEQRILIPQWLAAIGPGLGQGTTEHCLELAAVNGALWALEDQIRQLRAEIQTGDARDIAKCYSQAGAIGLQISTLNDRRASLVTLINCNITGAAAPSEKL